jgi:hypothetical protein
VWKGLWPAKNVPGQSTTPKLTEEGEILYLYLAVSPSAVSSVLIREESGVQKPVYFTSRVLHEAEERYPRIEKLAFALIIATRRLRPYFQAHAIRVLTEYPLKKILQKPDLSGRLVNWAVKLGELDLEFFFEDHYKGSSPDRLHCRIQQSPRERRASRRRYLDSIC